MGRKGPRFHAAALADNAAVAERVLERIRADGPLSSLDFERESGPTKDWFGMPENAVRAVLEAYTVTGVIGLARRDGNRRYYDLLERLLPAELLAHEVPEREQLRHKLLSRYRAHGLLWRRRRRRRSTFARESPEPPGRNELRKELVELGALVPVEVEGVRGKRFVLAEELALLQAPPEPPPSVAFIAPFDSLLWDTALLASLFDFDYVWEGFFPPAKRRWGYYVLPIVFGDRFVGRIEPRIDRDGARVEVLDVWWEDGFAPPPSRRLRSTPCVPRSTRTSASRAQARSNGRHTSERRQRLLPSSGVGVDGDRPPRPGTDDSLPREEARRRRLERRDGDDPGPQIEPLGGRRRDLRDDRPDADARAVAHRSDRDDRRAHVVHARVVGDLARRARRPTDRRRR